MTYYNTTRETGDLLGAYRAKAMAQHDVVAAYFRRVCIATPSQCHRDAFGEAVPLTSVRRAITNLTKAGVLRRTDVKRIGAYGRPEYAWAVEE